MHYAPYSMNPYMNSHLYRNQKDTRFFPFLPFVVGGLAGLAVAPFFYRPYYPPFAYQPYYPAPYYPPTPYYGGAGGYPIQ